MPYTCVRGGTWGILRFPGPASRRPGRTQLRLSPRQIEIINREARRLFGDDVRILLFGSRTDDEARGGDIDLLVESARPIPDRASAAARFAGVLQRRLGDQRIDVVIVAPGTRLQPIHLEALRSGIPL